MMVSKLNYTTKGVKLIKTLWPSHRLVAIYIHSFFHSTNVDRKLNICWYQQSTTQLYPLPKRAQSFGGETDM